MKRAALVVFLLGCPLVLGHVAQAPALIPTGEGTVTMPATTGLSSMAHTIEAARDGADRNGREVHVVPNAERR